MQLCNPSYNNDQFENTALTVNGKIGDLKLVYAGGYLVRNVDQQGDYTNYARGVYADYYQCTSASHGRPLQADLLFAERHLARTSRTLRHDSQELRLSTPDDWRLRGIGGAVLGGLHDPREYRLVLQDPAGLHHGRRKRLLDRRRSGARRRTCAIPNIRPDNESFFDDVTARLHAEGAVRLGRLRHHSEEADRDGRHPLLPDRHHGMRAARSAASAATPTDRRPAPATSTTATTSAPIISTSPIRDSRAAPT